MLNCHKHRNKFLHTPFQVQNNRSVSMFLSRQYSGTCYSSLQNICLRREHGVQSELHTYSIHRRRPHPNTCFNSKLAWNERKHCYRIMQRLKYNMRAFTAKLLQENAVLFMFKYLKRQFLTIFFCSMLAQYVMNLMLLVWQNNLSTADRLLYTSTMSYRF